MYNAEILKFNSTWVELIVFLSLTLLIIELSISFWLKSGVIDWTSACVPLEWFQKHSDFLFLFFLSLFCANQSVIIRKTTKFLQFLFAPLCEIYHLRTLRCLQSNKQTKMSITVSTCLQICNSPLNLSSSKQLFSFPKT